MEPALHQERSYGLRYLVREGLKYTDMERELDVGRDDAEYDDFKTFGFPTIKVVGVGGAGNNTVNRLYNIRFDEAEIVGINTDKQHLDVIKADKKIQIGKSLTRGLGAGSFPEIGQRAAELARSTLQEVLKDSDLVFITAGIGGGTGSGAAPVVAEIAREEGALVVGLVSTPFKVELAHMIKVEPHLSNLRKVSDIVIPLDLQLLLKHVPNLPLEQAYSVMDQLIALTVKDITMALKGPVLVSLDFADFEAIVREGGNAVLLAGECPVQDGPEKLSETVLSHPLSNDDVHTARGALIHITGGLEMTPEDAEKIVRSLILRLGPEIRVAWGASCDQEYEGKARAVMILTGIKKCPEEGTPAGTLKSGRKVKKIETIIDLL